MGDTGMFGEEACQPVDPEVETIELFMCKPVGLILK